MAVWPALDRRYCTTPPGNAAFPGFKVARDGLPMVDVGTTIIAQRIPAVLASCIGRPHARPADVLGWYSKSTALASDNEPRHTTC